MRQLFLTILYLVYKVDLATTGRNCDRDYFQENYVQKNATINPATLSSECANSNINCTKAIENVTRPFALMYGETKDHVPKIFISFDLDSLKIFPDCWGLAVQVDNKNGYDTKYFMNISQLSQGWLYSVARGEYYKISTIFLPVAKTISTEIIRIPANRCESGTFHGLKTGRQLAIKKQGRCNLNITDLFNLAEEICYEKGPKATVKQEYLTIIMKERCIKATRNEVLLPGARKQEGKTNVVLIVFLALVSVFCTALCAFILLRVIGKSFFQRKQRALSAKPLMSTESSRRDDVPLTIMILNRPGCDLLDILMVNLGCVLKAYGFEIKMALLEQTQIDAEGGIASYMQRNIDIADYILIACTEKKSIDKNSGNPYEFALRVIGGLAYHNNNSSRYIPIYLQDYSQAIELIPTFLSANTNTGFKIPEHIPSLVEYLACTTDNDEHKQLKMKYFVKEMQEISQKYLNEDHVSCCKGSCPRGKLIPRSVSVLSSVWSGNASKWSFRSTQDVNASIQDQIKAKSQIL